MHGAVLYAPWRIERESSARPGIPGPSCSDCWRAIPRSRSCTSPRRRTPAARSASCIPSLAPGLRAASGSRRSTPPTCRGLDLVFCALPHGESQALLPGLLDHVGHVDRPRRRLPAAARRVLALVRRGAPRARRRRPRSRTGSSSCTATSSRRTQHVASPGCYPTAVSLACAPLVALDLVEPRIVADAVSGVSGAGREL